MAYKSNTTPETWEERYSNASSNQAKQFKRFSNWYDSLYAIVGVVPSPWRSKMFVPVLARQTWALVSKFLNLKPGFEIRVQGDDLDNEKLEEKIEKAQRKLEYDYENPYLDESMRDKLFAPLLDAVVTGTGMAKVCWKTEERETYERLPSEDGVVDLSKEKKTTKKVTYNDLEPINIFNVFVSPSATNLYSAPWIIIKEFKALSELKAINKAKGVEIYKNLDKINTASPADDDFESYNYSRNRLINNQNRIDATVKMVKIFECYEGDSFCTYAEGGEPESDHSWVLIREQKNPYWHGKYPLVRFTIKNKPFQFWGEGLFETTYRLQAGYNDVFNHFLDQWNLAENSMLMIPESGNVNDYVVEPGGVLTFRGDTPPTQFKHQMPQINVLQEIVGLMDQAIEGVTVSSYASGIPNSETDKTKGTATGIKRLQDAAGDMVSFMRTNFQQSITQVGRMWLSNNQQYMDRPVSIQINNHGRKETMEVTPDDMQGDMDLIVDDASMEPASKDDQKENYLAFTTQLINMKQVADQQSQMLGTPPLALNFSGIAEDLAEKFGYRNFGSLLMQDEELQQAHEKMQQQMQAMAQGGEKEPKAPSESLNYKDAPEDIKRQIEEQAGLQPSESISPAGTEQLQKHAEMGEPQQSDPNADQQTVDLAHGLAQAGHIDPALLEHLPALPPTPPDELSQIRQAERTPNG